MSQLDLYRNIVTRKQEELSKLKQDLAEEEVKISPLRRKIISANSTIKQTKSQSTYSLMHFCDIREYIMLYFDKFD